MEGVPAFGTAYAALGSTLGAWLLTSGTYISRIGTVVLSRFLLDLRRAAFRPTISSGLRADSFSRTSDIVASQSELHFNSNVLGALGGSLSLDSGDDDEVPESSDEVSEQIDADMVAPESSSIG